MLPLPGADQILDAVAGRLELLFDPDYALDDRIVMEQFQSWCSMECGEQRIPSEDELNRMVNALMGLDVVLFPNA